MASSAGPLPGSDVWVLTLGCPDAVQEARNFVRGKRFPFGVTDDPTNIKGRVAVLIAGNDKTVQMPKLEKAKVFRVIRASPTATLVGAPEVPVSEIYGTLSDRNFWSQVGCLIFTQDVATPIGKQVLAVASELPEKTAIVYGEDRMTYSQLAKAARALLHVLFEKGVKPRDACAVSLAHCLNETVARLSLYLGRIVCNTVDPRTPAFMTHQLKVIPVKAVLADENTVKLDWGTLDVIVVNEVMPAMVQSSKLAEPAEWLEDDVLFYEWTSGSTGVPKGVGVTERMMRHWVHWRQFVFPETEDDPNITATNLFFTWYWHLPLCSGGTLVILPTPLLYSPEDLLVHMADQKVSRVDQFTPGLVTLISELGTDDVWKRLNQSLRIVICSAEAMPLSTGRVFKARVPNVQLINILACTETAADMCYCDVKGSVLDSGLKFAPVSGPWQNIETPGPYVVWNNELRIGEGQLVVVGRNIGPAGYVGAKPEANAKFFMEGTEAGIHLGDLVTTNEIAGEQYLVISGRADNCVKIRGHRVELEAVDNALLALTGVVDASCGVAGDQLIGFLVVPGEPSVADLFAELRQNLVATHMPSDLKIIPEMKYNMNGKRDRKALLATIEMPTKQAENGESAPASTGDPMKDTLRKAWHAILGKWPTSESECFFEAGGQSLSAMRMVAEVNRNLPPGARKLNITAVFGSPSFEAIAALMAPPTAPAPQTSGLGLEVLASRDQPAAVIGMAAQFAGCSSYAEMWELLSSNGVGIAKTSMDHLRELGWPEEALSNEDFVNAGGGIKDYDMFDFRFWQIPKAEAEFMDPQLRLFIQGSYSCLEDAGYGNPSRRRDSLPKFGVYATTWYSGYLLAHLHGGGLSNPMEYELAHVTEIGNLPEYAASRVAYQLDLKGPAVAIQTSCSSSHSTVIAGAEALRSRAIACDAVLAGAASVALPGGGHVYVEGMFLSPDGMCRAFDSKANGTVISDGVGLLTLRPVSSASEASDRSWSVIRGYGSNQDAAQRRGFSAPSPVGQEECIRQALQHARVQPSDVSYIECHGTGTLLGDPIEVHGLTGAFGGGNNLPLLGCVKPNLGHSNIASGMAGIIKVSLMLHHRKILPTRLLGTINPLIIEAAGVTPRIHVGSGPVDWALTEFTKTRIAGVSSYGIGGTNAHVILEERSPEYGLGEPPSSVVAAKGAEVRFLPLSAKTESSLREQGTALTSLLQQQVPNAWQSAPTVSPIMVARALALGREVFPWPHRLAVAVGDGTEHGLAAAAMHLTEALESTEVTSETPLSSTPPLVGLLFGGNGGFYAGMHHEMKHIPLFSKAYDAALDACVECMPKSDCNLRTQLSDASPLESFDGSPLLAMVGLFCVQYAVWEMLRSWGVLVDAAIGHSAGFYAAAVCTGHLSLKEAARLVVVRSFSAENDAPEGAMMFIGGVLLDDLQQSLHDSGISIAAVNGPQQLVVSGRAEHVASLEQRMRDKFPAARLRRLHVTRGYHHPELMAPVAATVEKSLSAAPVQVAGGRKCLLGCNIGGGWVNGDLEHASYYTKHLLQPVQFASNLVALGELGAKQGRRLVLLEIGSVSCAQMAANNIEAKLPKVISLQRHPKDDGVQAEVCLHQGLAAAWQQGLNVDFNAYFGDLHIPAQLQPFCHLPTYAFERSRCWTKCNDHRPQTSSVSGDGQTRLLRFVDRHADAKVSAYCIPYAGGSSAVFHAWAAEAPSWLDVVAVELPGRGIRSEFDLCKEGMEAYEKELKACASAVVADHTSLSGNFGSGAVAICGLSSGSIFAWNLAQLLQHQGIRLAGYIVAGRSPPSEPENSPDKADPSTWSLSDQKLTEREEAILNMDLAFDDTGSKRISTCTQRLECPIHVFCGAQDASMSLATVHGWGELCQSSACAEVALFKGGHDFLLTSDFRAAVRKSLAGLLAMPLTSPSAPVQAAAETKKAKAPAAKMPKLLDWLYVPKTCKIPLARKLSSQHGPRRVVVLLLTTSRDADVARSIARCLQKHVECRIAICSNLDDGSVHTEESIKSATEEVLGGAPPTHVLSLLGGLPASTLIASADCQKRELCRLLEIVKAVRSIIRNTGGVDAILSVICSLSAHPTLRGLALSATAETDVLVRLLDVPSFSPAGPSPEFPEVLARETLGGMRQGRLEPLVSLKKDVAKTGLNGNASSAWFREITEFAKLSELSPALDCKVGPRPEGHAFLREGQAFLITGGLGRIGKALGEFLAERWRAAVVLTTRKAPTSEDEQLAKKLSSLSGAPARILQSDFGSPQETLRTLKWAAKELGRPVDAVFHAAGVSKLYYLEETSGEQFESELGPKAVLTEYLQQAFSQMAGAKGTCEDPTPPALCMLFSSMAGVLGGYAMGPYASASCWLDAFAHSQASIEGTGSTVRYVAVDWDDWDFEYTDQVTEFYTGRLSMSEAEGTALMEAILNMASPPPQVLTSTTELERKITDWLQHSQRVAATTWEMPAEEPTDESKGDIADSGDTGALVLALQELVQSTLGLPALPGDSEQFFALGGDSVTAASLLRGVKAVARERSLPKGNKMTIAGIFKLQSAKKLAAALQ